MGYTCLCNDCKKEKDHIYSMIQLLPVKCAYCNWRGKIKYYRKHRSISHVHKRNNRKYNPKKSILRLSLKIRPPCSKTKNVEKEVISNLENYHYASYDGSLMWIITGFEDIIEQAKCEQQVSIKSPRFCSSPHGYDLQAELYPYGTGDAKGTHMSVFLRLNQGKHDAILQWPFKYQIIICLFDQTGQSKHIVDAFYPDTTSTSSSERPNSEGKLIGGILKFCPLEIIEQSENLHIQDNKIFLKITVDFLETPRPLLPFSMSINPGLPTSQQDAIRRKEIEKYHRARAALVAMINQNNVDKSRQALMSVGILVSNNTELPPSFSVLNSLPISCEELLHNE